MLIENLQFYDMNYNVIPLKDYFLFRIRSNPCFL